MLHFVFLNLMPHSSLPASGKHVTLHERDIDANNVGSEYSDV